MKRRFLAACLLAALLAAQLPSTTQAASRGRPPEDAGREQPRMSSEEKKRLRDRIGELEKQLKDLKKKVDSGRLTPEDERRLDRFLAPERGPGRPEMEGRPPMRRDGERPMEPRMRGRFGGPGERFLGPPPGPRPPMPPGPQGFGGPRFERPDIGPRPEGRDLPERGLRPPLPPPGRFQGPPGERREGREGFDGPPSAPPGPRMERERPSRPPGPEGRRPGQDGPRGPERPQPNE